MNKKTVVVVVILSLPMVSQARISDPADCTSRLIKTNARADVSASTWVFRDLSRRALARGDLMLGEAKTAIDRACFLFPGDGPFPSARVCEGVPNFVNKVNQDREKFSAKQWRSMIELWSQYLSAVADDMDAMNGWSPCGVQAEARSLGGDLDFLFWPITITVTKIRDTSKNFPGLYSIGLLVSPVMMVYGAAAFAGDTVTLGPSLVGKGIKTVRRKRSEPSAEAVFQSFIDAAAQFDKDSSNPTPKTVATKAP